jgi:hypothetical protein
MSTISPETPSGNDIAASMSEAPAQEHTAAPENKMGGASKRWRSLSRKWRALSRKWRAAISLSSLTALVALYTQVVIPRMPSQTAFEVTSADSEFLRLKVWNTGHKPSRLISYRLRFPPQLMIEDARLDQVDGDTVIDPGSASVALTVKELLRSCKPGDKKRFLKRDIETLLRKRDSSLAVEVEVEIQESGHLLEMTPHPFIVPRKDKPAADLVKNFLLGRIPDVDDNDDCDG